MEIKVYAGEGKYRVDLNVYCTGGSGLSGFLFGGTLPHVGGVALAAPTVELHGKKLSSCDEWTLTVPGHKDSYAANAVAKKICLAVHEAVSICSGIHIDDASGEEIKILLDNCLKAAELFIEQYLKKQNK